MKRTDDIRNRLPRPIRQRASGRFASALLAFGILAAAAGCSSSDPSGPGGETNFVYDPDRSEIEITILNSQFFKVSAATSGDLQAEWFVDGEKRFDGTGFNYFPASIGWDTVRVEVSAGGTSDARQWLVRVVQTEDELPGEVPGILIEHAPLPGEVIVSWGRVTATSHPIAEYVVAASYDGPVSTANWDEAMQLAVVEHVDGRLQYTGTFDLDDGVQVWFAVRARDELGQLSDITRVYDHRMSYPWSLGLQVQEAGGGPVAEVILRWVVGGVVHQGNTPFDGYYEIGPFRNIDVVHFETQMNNGGVTGEYYDYVNPEVTVEDAPLLDIHLIPRRTIDEQCTTELGDQEFLTYFRARTRTNLAYAIRPNQQLLRWETYPLQVYVPEFERGDGVDMKAAAVAAVERWNSVMGEPYFELVDDAGTADVRFEFTDLIGKYGYVSLLEPSDAEYFVGMVAPEKMLVEIDSEVLTESDFLLITNIHELGHVLGIYEHSYCLDSPYLMNLVPVSSVNDANGGIHPDEQLTVRMIRYLPQATEMDLYVLD